MYIELLIEILEKTPSNDLCGVVNCTHLNDCSLCPLVSDYKKEILVEDLEELLHEAQ